MGLAFVFNPDLEEGETWERASKLVESHEFGETRGRLIEIDVPGFQGATVQAHRNSVTVFCGNLKELQGIKRWLTEKLDCEFGVPSTTKQQGMRDLYYCSLGNVNNLLENLEYPPDIHPDEFKYFVNKILGNYCEGDRITLPDATQITGIDQVKAEEYLETMENIGFTHMKPPKYQLEKSWHIGCPPEEEVLAMMESAETGLAAAAYGAIKSGVLLLRPLALPLYLVSYTLQNQPGRLSRSNIGSTADHIPKDSWFPPRVGKGNHSTDSMYPPQHTLNTRLLKELGINVEKLLPRRRRDAPSWEEVETAFRAHT